MKNTGPENANLKTQYYCGGFWPTFHVLGTPSIRFYTISSVQENFGITNGDMPECKTQLFKIVPIKLRRSNQPICSKENFFNPTIPFNHFSLPALSKSGVSIEIGVTSLTNVLVLAEKPFSPIAWKMKVPGIPPISTCKIKTGVIGILILSFQIKRRFIKASKEHAIIRRFN